MTGPECRNIVFVVERFVYINETSSMDITLPFNHVIDVINTGVPTWTDAT